MFGSFSSKFGMHALMRYPSGFLVAAPSVFLEVLEQKPPRQKPPDKNPLDKNLPSQKPPRQNILFRNFITFVFRMSYGKEISIWFLAVKHIRHGFIK